MVDEAKQRCYAIPTVAVCITDDKAFVRYEEIPGRLYVREIPKEKGEELMRKMREVGASFTGTLSEVLKYMEKVREIRREVEKLVKP